MQPPEILAPRRLGPEDDLDHLTRLLHASYAPLAAAGMRFLATHQSVETTRARTQRGETWVLTAGGVIVATITLEDPLTTGGCLWYDRPDVASFHQLAVDPAHQGRGLGRRLVEHAAGRARALGAAELALDTSERAAELLARYRAWGFREVGHAQWEGVNYRSVILSRAL